jgi:hypothetical protein
LVFSSSTTSESAKRVSIVNGVFSIPVSLLIFLTLLTALDIARMAYFETIYRVTRFFQFQVTFTNSAVYDGVLATALGIVTALILFRQKRLLSCALSGALFAAMIAVLVLNNPAFASGVTVSVLPLIFAVWVFERRRKSKDENKKREEKPSRINRDSLILALTGLFLAIGVSSLFTWIAYPAFPSRIYSNTYWAGATLEATLFYTFGLLSPFLAVLLFFSYAFRPSFNSLMVALAKRKSSATTAASSNPTMMSAEPPSSAFSSSARGIAGISKARLFLIISSIIVIVLGIYPYLPTVNPDFLQVSVDAPYYINQINVIKNEGLFSPNGPFGFANERALSILVFYGIAEVTQQSAASIIAFLPAFLGLLSVLSVYKLVRHVFGPGHPVVLYAPLLTAFSHQFVVGIYGGFFSNMLALPLLFVAILFFLRYSESTRRRKLNLSIFVIATLSALLIHIYTWVFLAATLVIAIGILVFTSGKDVGKARTLKQYAPILAVFGMTIVVMLAIATQVKSTSGLGFLVNLTSSSVGQDFFAARWFNLNYMFRVYLGGFLTNSAAIFLALVWAFKADYRNRFEAVVLSSMFLLSFFFFFGDPVAQSRIFYDLALQIPVAIMLGKLATGSFLGSLSPLTRNALILLVMVHFANYALRSLANFYLLPL